MVERVESIGRKVLHRITARSVDTPLTNDKMIEKYGVGAVIVQRNDTDDRDNYWKWVDGYTGAYDKWFKGEGAPLLEKSQMTFQKKLRNQVLGLLKGGDYRAQNVLSMMETVQSAYVAPSVSGIGPAKHMLTEWWFNPIWGQPRLSDLRVIKQLARSHIGSMAIEAILDSIMQIGWDIIPKDLTHPNAEDTQKQMDVIKDFLDNPNRNHDDWDKLMRMYIRNILETDDGTLVLVYDEYVSPPVPQSQYAATGEIRAYTAQPAWDAVPAPDSQLIEIFAEDGSSFLKQVDMHGYEMNFWQYSFVVPRRPVRFETREIVYTSQNPRAGTRYGYSPFESVTDTLKFILEAFKYNRAFFENSGIPSIHLDFLNIKDPARLKEVDNWIRETFVGSDKAYRVLTTNGGVKVTPLNFTNKDLQMLEMQNFYIDLVLAKLKVPAELLGLSRGSMGSRSGGGSSRGGLGTQAAIMRSRAIKPIITLVENSFNMHLIPRILGIPKDQVLCQFKFGPMTDLDEEERKARIYQVALSTGLKYINELRIIEGLDPVPWGWIPFIPQAGLMHPLESLVVQKPGAGANGRPQGENPPASKPPETLAESRARPIPSSTGKPPTPNEGVGANISSIAHGGGTPTIGTVGPSGKSLIDDWMESKLVKYRGAIVHSTLFKDYKIDTRKKLGKDIVRSNSNATSDLKHLLIEAADYFTSGVDPDNIEKDITDRARKNVDEWLNRNALVAMQDASAQMNLPKPDKLTAKELEKLKPDKEKVLQEFHGILMDLLVELKANDHKGV